jgi:hypothetical protein
VSSSDKFRAYTFVDRVTMVQPGVSVRGTYAIPATLRDFHSSLVAEATGQLAAWCALPAVDFKMRPVAGIADRVEVLAPVHPGDTIELAAEIESVDKDAIAYRGTASVEGSPVLHLYHCVGPMLRAEDFDDPQALRDHYAVLCGAGAEPGGFEGVPDLDLEDVNGEEGKILRAKLQGSNQSGFFPRPFSTQAGFPRHPFDAVDHRAGRSFGSGNSRAAIRTSLALGNYDQDEISRLHRTRRVARAGSDVD